VSHFSGFVECQIFSGIHEALKMTAKNIFDPVRISDLSGWG